MSDNATSFDVAVWDGMTDSQKRKDVLRIVRERDALAADRDRLAQLIKEHNDACQSACGVGDEEGVACKYRTYFPRRCPECPVDWQIDAALQEKRDE